MDQLILKLMLNNVFVILHYKFSWTVLLDNIVSICILFCLHQYISVEKIINNITLYIDYFFCFLLFLTSWLPSNDTPAVERELPLTTNHKFPALTLYNSQTFGHVVLNVYGTYS